LQYFISAAQSDGSPQNPLDYVLTTLSNKIASYEGFVSRWPGFAGYLPWFASTDQGISPIQPDWYGVES
jgi:hypothetical protein